MVFIRSFLKTQHSSDESHLLTSVKYNLKQLLESEAPLIVLDADLTECKRSIFSYGVEDIQSLNYQLGKNIFTSRIKSLIDNFEYRIENVEINILTNDDKSNAISFIISGDLVDGQEFQLNSKLNISDFSLSMENEIV
ncbi:GPW/gp25 family protein [Pseudoalteromonas denitrificans]|jgi:predicted component of type VI protein secretion system|uniref:Gene 25-like lysozyme n=1 Tax=Pseudoalteromonas denitrificans DSM 6059 TaxID=1123010 RepID=A0A1I1GM05_9GAMM|nr:GPW/gp25 family protein [Pseudoalteromonas denitrificans]SFC12475.1 Gene 25-like lysozyme [Pseudoalteromonas denitrificans DSM 6059]